MNSTATVTEQETTGHLHQIRDRIIAAAAITPGNHVIVAGAGISLLAPAALAAAGPDGVVVAIDQDDDVLDGIRGGLAASALQHAVGDPTRLPVPDGSMDAICMQAALAHLTWLPDAMEEAARVLVPGGRLSAGEPLIARQRHNARLRIKTSELRAIDDLLTTATRASLQFDETSILAYAKSAGFSDATAHRELVTTTLDDRDAVDDHLNRPLHPGTDTNMIEVISDLLGMDLAVRWTDAWTRALAVQGQITLTTPIIYVTATRA